MSKPKFNGVIRSVRLTAKGNLQVNYVDHVKIGDDFANRELKSKTDKPPHKDLMTALSVLKGHAGVICELFPRQKTINEEYMKIRNAVKDPDLSLIEVRGFTYKSGGDDQSVILHVRKNLSKGGFIDFEAPSVRVYEGSDYDFSGNLADDLADVEIEVAKYMDGKFDDRGQMNMFEQETEEVSEL